jgi:hypothetical protein
VHPIPLHSSNLLAAGFHALGSIPTPEVLTHYFVHPTGCLLVSVAEMHGRTRLREYTSHPLEVLAVATLCLDSKTGNRTESVRLAHEHLTHWGLQWDQAEHATA